MRRIWNVAPFALTLDAHKPAVQPCASVSVSDDVALELTSGPDWSYDNPRQPKPNKLVVRKVGKITVESLVEEASTDMVAEGSPVTQ